MADKVALKAVIEDLDKKMEKEPSRQLADMINFLQDLLDAEEAKNS